MENTNYDNQGSYRQRCAIAAATWRPKMSTQCKTCQKEINWNPKKREELHIRGPLNPDMTIHYCYKEQEANKVVIDDSAETQQEYKAELSADEIYTLKQFVALLKVVSKQ